MEWSTMSDPDNELRALMINLVALGKIDPGFKVNTKDTHLTLDDSGWQQPFLRWYRGDNRNAMIEKINYTLNELSKVIDRAMKKENKGETYMDLEPDQFLGLIYKKMQKSKRGLGNLSSTYRNDVNIYSQIQLNQIVLNQKIAKIKQHLGLEPEPFPDFFD